MKRLALAVALACALSVSALAGDIHSTGAPEPAPGDVHTAGAPAPQSPGEVPSTGAPGEISTTGSPSPGDMPTVGLSVVLTILDLVF